MGKNYLNQVILTLILLTNTLEEGIKPAQTTTYASFGGYVEDFVESCQFTNFDGSPYLTLKLKED